MTPRAQALLAYFYTIATTPSVVAAGKALSAIRFKDAVLACVAEDLPIVAAFVLRGAAIKVEAPAKAVVGGATRTALGGSLPPKAAEHAAGAVEELLGEGFKWAMGKIGEMEKKGKRRS